MGRPGERTRLRRDRKGQAPMKSLLAMPRRLRSCLELEPTDHFQGTCQSVQGSGSSPGGPGHHRSQSMRGLTLTQREQARLQVLNSVLEHQIQVDGAAQVLGVSKRHLWRTLAAYRKEGAAALAYGNRGRPPRNATPEGTKAEVGYLARTSYPGANHTHLTELLAQSRSEPHASDRVAGTARGDRPGTLYGASHSSECRYNQSPSTSAATTPCPTPTHASSGDVGADRRKPSSVAGRARTQVRPAVGRR